jgi:hypothetical protein
MSIVNTLKNLKTNLFGGPSNTGFAQPGPSKVQGIGMTGTPTSSLDSDPLSFGTYQFPKDVFENQQLGHYMVFYVNKTNQSKYVYGKNAQQRNTIIDNIKTSTKDNSIFENLKGEYAKKQNYILAKAKQRIGTNAGTGEPDLSTSNRNSAALQGFSATKKTTTRISDSIALYLPPNVAETTSARYEDTPTGILGVAAQDIIEGFNSFQMKDFEKTGKIAGRAISVVAQEILKNLGGGFIEALTGTEGVVPLANKVFGRAENPFVEVFFNTMNIRTFTYNFNFAPRNEAETNEIQQIIQLFRFHMAPEMQATNNRYLTLPSEFDIHYMYKANNGQSYENDFYGRIGTCVLENVSTNYTPNGVKSFASGAPTQITMSLTFRETELLTKEKINQGY